jgi:ankyrin repeat protein
LPFHAGQAKGVFAQRKTNEILSMKKKKKKEAKKKAKKKAHFFYEMSQKGQSVSFTSEDSDSDSMSVDLEQLRRDLQAKQEALARKDALLSKKEAKLERKIDETTGRMRPSQSMPHSMSSVASTFESLEDSHKGDDDDDIDEKDDHDDDGGKEDRDGASVSRSSSGRQVRDSPSRGHSNEPHHKSAKRKSSKKRASGSGIIFRSSSSGASSSNAIAAMSTEKSASPMMSPNGKFSRAALKMRDVHQKTRLHLACEAGDLALVKMIMKKSAGAALLNAVDKNDWMPLHCAMAGGKWQVASFLLEQPNLDVRVRNDDDATPLHFAVKHESPLKDAERANQAHAFDSLIGKGASVYARSRNGEFPLHMACWKGNVFLAERCLKHVTNANLLNIRGESPLHYAVLTGNVELARLLLDRRADRFIANVHGLMPHDFAEAGYADTKRRELVVELLNTHSAATPSHPDEPDSDDDGDLDDVGDDDDDGDASDDGDDDDQSKSARRRRRRRRRHRRKSRYRIHRALHNGDIERAIRLMEHCDRVDLLAVDSMRMTALHYAAVRGNIDILAKMLSKLAAFKKQQQAGEADAATASPEASSSSAAASSPKKKVDDAATLGDVSLRNVDGNNVLHLLSRYRATGSFETAAYAAVVRKVCEAASGMSVAEMLAYTNELKETALHLACASSNVKAATYLLQTGARVDAVTAQGYSALDYAVIAGSRPLVVLLLAHGAQPSIATADIAERTQQVSLLEQHLTAAAAAGGGKGKQRRRKGRSGFFGSKVRESATDLLAGFEASRRRQQAGRDSGGLGAPDSPDALGASTSASVVDHHHDGMQGTTSISGEMSIQSMGSAAAGRSRRHSIVTPPTSADFGMALLREDPMQDFFFLSRAGEGAHGHVDKAQHKVSGEIVAIKTIAVADEAERESIKSEIGILEGCAHENIVRYHGCFFAGNSVHIVLDFCSVGSVSDLRAMSGDFTESQIAAILRGILSGLHYLHSLDIIHRDMKVCCASSVEKKERKQRKKKKKKKKLTIEKVGQCIGERKS